MAKRYSIGATGDVQGPIYLGETPPLRFQIVKKNPTGAEIVQGDVSANAFAFSIREHPGDTGAALVAKATGGTGITFANGDTAAFPPELAGTNTVVVVAIADTDIDALLPDVPYHFDLKRSDAGAEAVVAAGTITF